MTSEDRDKVASYNAGYPRGLHTEYHKVPINWLFINWTVDARTVLKPNFDEFKNGYEQGMIDYKEACDERVYLSRPQVG